MPGRDKSFWDKFLNYYLRPMSDFVTMGLSEIGWQQRDKEEAAKDQQFQDIMNGAEKDPIATQGQLAAAGLNPNAETEKYLDNLIAAYNTQSARQWEEQMANTDLLRAASQLQQIGLSPSGVLQTGGSTVNGVAAADNVKSNVALERYQQRMALAKQLLSMTSSMASAGIYGNAIGTARKASALMASQAAHSARMVTRYDANDNRVGRSISEVLDPEFDYGQLF